VLGHASLTSFRDNGGLWTASTTIQYLASALPQQDKTFEGILQGHESRRQERLRKYLRSHWVQ
jgi:16S rRNA C1402 (ribose-2'-O) methylase RsmI